MYKRLLLYRSVSRRSARKCKSSRLDQTRSVHQLESDVEEHERTQYNQGVRRCFPHQQPTPIISSVGRVILRSLCEWLRKSTRRIRRLNGFFEITLPRKSITKRRQRCPNVWVNRSSVCCHLCNKEYLHEL